MTEELMGAASVLAREAALGDIVDLQLLAGGGNNRVFRLAAQRGVACLKVYFRHPDDTRDRLGAEYAFSQFAWNQGLRCLPRPLGCNPSAGMALFEFVVGQAVQAGEVGANEIDQALAFFLGLNLARRSPEAHVSRTSIRSLFQPGRASAVRRTALEALERPLPGNKN